MINAKYGDWTDVFLSVERESQFWANGYWVSRATTRPATRPCIAREQTA
jgi:hypothetical protein